MSGARSSLQGAAPRPTRFTQFGDGAITSFFLGITFLFVLSTLFDPADLIFGLKVPLYLLCWAAGVVVCLTRPDRVRLPNQLLLYVLLMIAIPIFSIANYYFVDGSAPFAGFQLLKAYLFMSMATLLCVTSTNLLPYLSAALSLLALSIIVVAVAVMSQPALFLPVYHVGNQYGIFSVASRDYGSGLVLFQMYFVTSPMLAIAAAYYFDLAWRTPYRRLKYGYAFLTLLNLVALFLAGSRNNMLAAVVLPLALLFVYSKRKGLTTALIAFVTTLGIVSFAEQIRILLDPLEASNRTKLMSLGDYGTILANVPTLLLGRGLGAYEQWTGRGYFYQTELTYLEIIRNFGLVLGGIIIVLLLYPIGYAFILRPSYPERNIIIGYAMYLLMCVSNPLLFSSMGMLILSVITANIALYEMRQAPAPATTAT